VLLAAAAGWMAVGNIAATDMPLAATFNASLLAALIWLDTGRRRWAVIAGAFLGLALLAKGLVGAVLFLPLLWFARRDVRGLFLLFASASLVALPWYVAITLRHGMEFIRVFFLQHHFARFTQPSLLHVQPFWFYVPVLLGLVFPWTPLFALLRRSTFQQHPERVLTAVAVCGFVFFSISANKLPGYLLPILPAVCLLLARAVVQSEAPRGTLAACGLLLFLMPVASAALPQILLVGLRRSTLGDVPWEYLALAVAAAMGAWWLAKNRGTATAVALLALFTAAAWLQIKLVALPVVDQVVSARSLWRQVESHRTDACVESLNRSLSYGLNYYSVTPLPDCSVAPKPYRITQAQGQPPTLITPQPAP
jgi:4-amino-4-deoxy-L-arabinose transferase-like glycosyltransferase